MALHRFIKIIALCIFAVFFIILCKDIITVKKYKLITSKKFLYHNQSDFTKFNSRSLQEDGYKKSYSFIDFTNEYNIFIKYLIGDSNSDENVNTVRNLTGQRKISTSEHKTYPVLPIAQFSDKNSNFISLKSLLAVCIHAAKVAGMELREIHKKFELRELRGKSVNNLTTSNLAVFGTLQSHRAMIDILRKVFPKIKVKSKWGGIIPPRFSNGKYPDFPKFDFDGAVDDVVVPVKDILVWMNPLDGVREYQRGYLDYVTTMMCVAVNGKPVIGVIHEPFQNTTVWGWKDKKVSSNSIYGFSDGLSHSRPATVVVADSQSEYLKVKRELGSDAILMIAGGAGYKSLLVARRIADAFLHVSYIKKWDICAGNAVLNSLNGTMTDLDGTEIDYGDGEKITNKRGVIASLIENELYYYLVPTILMPNTKS